MCEHCKKIKNDYELFIVEKKHIIRKKFGYIIVCKKCLNDLQKKRNYVKYK